MARSTKQEWHPPDVARLEAILARLRTYYGVPDSHPHGAVIDELVLTVLSQNTNDRNRDIAYERLVTEFPSWEQVRDAPVVELEAAIAPGGISKVKSARIKAILEQIGDPLDLGWLERAELAEARSYLCSLPGVGRKTAACVLLFAFGRPDIPVDTHVGRVGTRLGLFRPGASFDEMHDFISSLTPIDRAHETHVNLIRHGRRLCHARSPKCGECPLLAICEFGQAAAP